MPKRRDLEGNIQKQVVRYLRMQYPTVLFTASIAGIETTMLQMVRLKAMGYLKGTPDLMILEPSCPIGYTFHGLFIELKADKKTSKASPEQKDFIDRLQKRGYEASICYGFDEAKYVIDSYLRGKIV